MRVSVVKRYARVIEPQRFMTDDKLIVQFLDGNVHAFNTLVWRWQKPVYNFISRYLGDRELARDISQKTFVRVYDKLHGLQQVEKFSTWLFQIAVNLCRDELKAIKRRPLLSLDELRENSNGGHDGEDLVPPEPQPDPEQQACANDLTHLLNRALQEISEPQRVVIIMKEYQNLKFKEIADILGISENTAKSRMYYGLAALRKVFKEWKIDKESVNDEM